MKLSELPRLGTERLRLRPPTGADARALFAIFRDPEVTRYWSSPPMRRVAEAATLIREIRAEIRSDELYEWVVVRREDDAVVGTCTLGNLSLENRRGEIGYALAREAWGYGYMSELLPELVRWAFEDLGLHRLEADVDPRHEASLRLLRRLGFRREGRLRERWCVTGEYQDSLLLGLLQPDWSRRR